MARDEQTVRRETLRALQFIFGAAMDSGGPMPAVRNAFPAYRVFLYGFEITADVIAINIQNNVGKQPNTCAVTLLNERDKYVLTTEDMLFLTQIDPRIFNIPTRDLGRVSVSETTDQLIETLAASDRRPGLDAQTDDFRLSNPTSIKNQIFFLKQQHSKIDVETIDEAGIPTGVVPRSRYPYVDGVPIFHPNDPVRVFIRDVFDSTVWYYGFSGLVTDMTDDVGKDNQKTLTVASEDPTKLLRYARATANPGILDAGSVSVITDEMARGAYTSLLANRPLENIIDFLVFGTHREMPPGAAPEISQHFSFNEDQTGRLQASSDVSRRELEEIALASGLIKGIDSNFIANPDAPLTTQLTEQQQQDLKNYVDRQEALATERANLAQDAFALDFINQFGDKITKRFGLDGVGAFKPARDDGVRQIRDGATIRRIADLQSMRAPTADNSGLGNVPGVTDADINTLSARVVNNIPANGPYLFSLGEDPEAPVDTTPVSLEEWNDIISWRVSPTDIELLLNKDTDPATFKSTLPRKGQLNTIDDIITLIGEDPVNFPVDGGRLFMYLPVGAGTVGREVIAEDLLGSWQTRTSEFQNRLGLIYEALDRIEFLFYCTPKGDLVVEFPLYDFDFDDFGERYQRAYIVENDDLFSSSSTFSDAAVRTIAQVNVALSNLPSIDRAAQQGLRPTVVKIPSMFPTYGTRAENSNLRGLIQTERAARIFGNILLNRINADAHSVSLPIVPRFDVGLNRPVLWKLRNHIGTTVSVNHNIQWNGSWRTTLGVNHMRGWAGQLDEDGNMIYFPLTGQNSRPINYKLLFEREEVSRTPDINEALDETLNSALGPRYQSGRELDETLNSVLGPPRRTRGR
mgnify:CR=1 FL=1